MNKRIKMVSIGVLFVMFLLSVSACSWFGIGKGNDEQQAPIDITIKRVGVDNIIISDCVYPDNEYYPTQYKMNDEEWQDRNGYNEFTFDKLEPGVEYSIYARAKARRGYNASVAFEKKVSTKKYSDQSIDGISVSYLEKTVTVAIENAELAKFLSVSYDDGTTWTQELTHDYVDIGQKNILAKIVETPTHYESEVVNLSIFVSGFYSGTGKPNDPYIINTYEHFMVFANEESNSTESKYNSFKLGKDISFVGKKAFTKPLILSKPWTDNLGDTGTFDGNNKKLIGITCEYRNLYQAALFSRGYEIRDLNIENITVNVVYDGVPTDYQEYVQYQVGGIGIRIHNIINTTISGSMMITTKNGFVWSKAAKSFCIGGMTGVAYDTALIKDCISSVDITYNSEIGRKFDAIDGIVAFDYHGELTLQGSQYTGKIVDNS